MSRPQMVQYRQRQGLSQERLAQFVGVSTSTVTNWERGEYSPQHRYRPKLAEALGVSLTELALLLDGAELTSSPALNGAAPEWLNLFAKAEQSASKACVFQAIVVPALLQTREYATAVEGLGHNPVSDVEIARLVEMRMARQSVLERDPPLHLVAVVDESVLVRPAGGASVLRGQLDHLLGLMRRPTIDIRIIRGEGAIAASFGAFSMLTTAGASCPDLACNEGLTGMTYQEGMAEVRQHADLFAHLVATAADPATSARIIEQARETIR